MKPRLLKLQRIDDSRLRLQNDILSSAPVEILPDISKWLDFCKLLAAQEIPDFELLTIDFNFDEDQTTPRFPPPSNPDYIDQANQDDPMLRRLRWSNRLQHKGTGLVIGATLINVATYRDLPIGAATYTGFSDIPTRDVTSALLLGQILASCDGSVPMDNSRSLLRYCINSAMNGTFHNALPLAASRFRQAFLQRTCMTSGRLSPSSLWVRLESVWALQAAIKSISQDDLTEKLRIRGLEFYDRNGRFDSLSLNSLFLDRLVDRDGEGKVSRFRAGLSLEDVNPNTESGKSVHNFLEELSDHATTNVEPIVNFLRGSRSQTVNLAFPSWQQRLMALLFAYCDQYAERHTSYGLPWNSLAWESDASGDFASLFDQLRSLLSLLNEEGDSLPLSAQDSRSIMKVVHEVCDVCEDNALSSALGYNELNSNDSGLPSKRSHALREMLKILVSCGAVDEQDGKYRARSRSLPASMRLSLDRQDLNRRLGFADQNVPMHLSDIVRGSHMDPAMFFEGLESTPLPAHLRKLCANYMREEWATLQQKDWPPCLKGYEKAKELGGVAPIKRSPSGRPIGASDPGTAA